MPKSISLTETAPATLIMILRMGGTRMRKILSARPGMMDSGRGLKASKDTNNSEREIWGGGWQ